MYKHLADHKPLLIHVCFLDGCLALPALQGDPITTLGREESLPCDAITKQPFSQDFGEH